MEMVINHCDGWMPIRGYPEWPQIRDGISRIKSGLNKLVRPADAIEYSIFCWAPPTSAILNEMQRAGVTKVVITLEASDLDTALPLLDDYAQLPH